MDLRMNKDKTDAIIMIGRRKIKVLPITVIEDFKFKTSQEFKYFHFLLNRPEGDDKADRKIMVIIKLMSNIGGPRELQFTQTMVISMTTGKWIER